MCRSGADAVVGLVEVEISRERRAAEASRQDVLQESPQELDPGSRSVRQVSLSRSFQRKVTCVSSMVRIRALLIAVRNTYRDR